MSIMSETHVPRMHLQLPMNIPKNDFVEAAFNAEVFVFIIGKLN